MVVKRGAALAAGLVVVAGLVGGCAQKPGVAAVVTLKSCGSGDEAAPAVRLTAGGSSPQWVCADGSEATDGAVTTITSADLADAQSSFAAAELNPESSADVLSLLIQAQTVLQVAEEYGVTAQDDEVDELLQSLGAQITGSAAGSAAVIEWVEDHIGARDSTDSLWLLAQYNVVVIKLDQSEDGATVYEAALGVLSSQDVDVNPRFGTFDAKQFAVVPPAWAPTETLAVGL